jgi:hypothetical protein
MPMSKREYWFTLIRAIIVIALIGTAARLVAIAYAPQFSAMPQPLDCPPDVVTHSETVAPPQVLGVIEQSAASVTSDDRIASKSDIRSMIGKKKGSPSGAKKPAAYAFARNGVSQKRAAMGEQAKRGGIDANQRKKWKAPVPTLARSEFSQSAFGDMHGQ